MTKLRAISGPLCAAELAVRHEGSHDTAKMDMEGHRIVPQVCCTATAGLSACEGCFPLHSLHAQVELDYYRCIEPAAARVRWLPVNTPPPPFPLPAERAGCSSTVLELALVTAGMRERCFG